MIMILREFWPKCLETFFVAFMIVLLFFHTMLKSADWKSRDHKTINRKWDRNGMKIGFQVLNLNVLQPILLRFHLTKNNAVIHVGKEREQTTADIVATYRSPYCPYFLLYFMEQTSWFARNCLIWAEKIRKIVFGCCPLAGTYNLLLNVVRNTIDPGKPRLPPCTCT